MADKITLTISLQGQGLNGAQALDIRAAIEEQIESNTASEVIGGGCEVDGSGFDLHIETNEPEQTAVFIDGLMAHAELQERYTLSR